MKKPNIEQVYEIFNTLGNDMRRIISEEPPGTWKKKLNETRAECKRKLDEIGIGQHIDWSNNNK